jgi:hypothetical protein
MNLLRSSALAAVLAFSSATIALPPAAQAQLAVGISVGFAPPPLPVYVQPAPPGPGYIWTPGYWGWDPVVYDYYWIPGTWVFAPSPGLLWTPAWWGWSDGVYLFHAGYWGPEVGFYGGIVYGFGYDGVGYDGGYWRGRSFYYNSAVNNLAGARFANVYSRPMVVNRRMTASFNGPGGIAARPSQRQLAAATRGGRVAPTAMQVRNMRAAEARPAMRASANRGAPPLAATARPGAFSGRGVVRASEAGGAWRPPAQALARQQQAHNGQARPAGRESLAAQGLNERRGEAGRSPPSGAQQTLGRSEQAARAEHAGRGGNPGRAEHMGRSEGAGRAESARRMQGAEPGRAQERPSYRFGGASEARPQFEERGGPAQGGFERRGGGAPPERAGGPHGGGGHEAAQGGERKREGGPHGG